MGASAVSFWKLKGMALEPGLVILEARTLPQGATYEDQINITDAAGADIDLSTGYSAIVEIREAPVDSGALALFTSDDAGAITLANGSFTLTLSATETEEIATDADLETIYCEVDITHISSSVVTSFRWPLKVSKEYAREVIGS